MPVPANKMEISALIKIIKTLSEENELLKRQLIAISMIERDNFIRNILSTADALSDKEFEYFSSIFELRFPGKDFLNVLFTVKTPVSDNSPDSHLMHAGLLVGLKSVADSRYKENDISVVSTSDDSSISVLISFDSKSCDGDIFVRKISDIAISVKKSMLGYCDCHIQIVISDVFSGYEGIYRSYENAQNINNSITKGVGEKIFRSSDVSTSENLKRQNNRRESALSQFCICIQVKDYENAKRLLPEIYQSDDSRHGEQKNTYVPLVIATAVKESGMGELEKQDEICALMSASDKEFFLEKAYEALDNLALYSNALKNGVSPLFLKIKNYIRENYFNSELTVATIADRFKITPSYCAQLFKKYNDIGVLEYINHRRVTKAKGLFGMGYTLKEIAIRVGYTTPRAFSRAYYKLTGTMPSEDNK